MGMTTKNVNRMTEIRIKVKTFVIASVTVLFLIFYLIARSPKCHDSLHKISASTYQQVVSSKNELIPAFTVYCITPTYARPVQKAELTR